jgi:hypothetical protein
MAVVPFGTIGVTGVYAGCELLSLRWTAPFPTSFAAAALSHYLEWSYSPSLTLTDTNHFNIGAVMEKGVR